MALGFEGFESCSINNSPPSSPRLPLNDVCQWFIDRWPTSLRGVRPTKLDVGLELEMLSFRQLKGRESRSASPHKADNLATRDLMRVSFFWPYDYAADTSRELFQARGDLPVGGPQPGDRDRLENKIAFIRQHGIRLRIHALLVDRYVQTYNDRDYFSRPRAGVSRRCGRPRQVLHLQVILAKTNESKGHHHRRRPPLLTASTRQAARPHQLRDHCCDEKPKNRYRKN
ncbi:unnamed protein product [Boreogadus saida]